MEKHIPLEILDQEWKEIMKVTRVKMEWGIEPEETVENFRACVYGVKFKFSSGVPGYCGDIFMILGDCLELPVVLIREEGQLKPLSF